MAYVRKTRDEWQLWANFGYGWDYVLSEENKRDIILQVREYRKNTTAALRVRKIRVRVK